MPRIEELFAFIAENAGPDDEGVTAFRGPGGFWMPMVGADRARVDSLREIAVGLAKVSGQRIRLVRFTNRIEEEVIDP